MSTQLEALGIALIEGFDPSQLDAHQGRPVRHRQRDHARQSADGSDPESRAAVRVRARVAARNVLPSKWVLAVAGTHGKTTTSSMLAWILEHAGLEPGFLIGGVPLDFGVSARAHRARISS